MKKVVSRFCPSCSREFGPDEHISVCPVDDSLLHVVSEEFQEKLIGDRYQMIGVIGEGGWSTVYKAKDTKLNRNVAVKLLHRHLVASPEKVQRFQQEAESAAALAHTNVVVTYDFGMLEDGQPFIVMEFLQGRSFNSVLNEEGRLGYQRLIDLMLPVCEGMHAAHEKGLVHRDLKPGNIFVTRNDQGDQVVKVVDFGLAKVVETGQGLVSSHLTETGATLGTPAYMSPEQCMGRPLDRRSDIYAMGCIMYEAIVGEKPFEGETPFDCMLKHLNEAPTAFAAQNVKISVPPSLERAIFRCLAKEPAHRFQTARDLSTELRRAAVEACATPLGQSTIARIVSPKNQTTAKLTAGAVAIVIAGLGIYAAIAAMRPPEPKKTEVMYNGGLKPLATAIDEGSLSIIDSTRITDDVLAERLKKYSGYQDLDLSDSKITDKGVALLKNAPRLKTLMLHRCHRVTDAAMDDLSKITSLCELDLRGTRVTDAGIAKVVGLPQLESVWLSGEDITDASCKSLAKMQHLQLLQADDTRIGDKGIEELKVLTKLKQLRLDHTLITDAALRTIGGMSDLVRLNMTSTKITDAGLPAITRLSKMRQLSMASTKVSDAGMTSIAKLPTLEDLDLSYCHISDRGAAVIAGIPSLMVLQVAGTAISDDGLKNFARLGELIKLNIKAIKASKKAIQELEEKLPDCKIDDGRVPD